MQYEVRWIEQNKDGYLSEESIKMKATDSEDAVKQVHAVGNVVEVKTVTRLI
jgi:hypothetical protein